MTLAAPFIRILIALGVAGALALACFWAGYSKGDAARQVEYAQAQTKAASAAVTNAGAAIAATRKVEDQHTEAQVKARVVYRTIIKRVHDDVRANPHYADCGLDADGVRDWNAASAGALTPAAGDVDDGLRPAAAVDPHPAQTGSAATGGERSAATGEPR